MAEYIDRDKVFNKSDILTVRTREYGSIEVVPVEYLADLPIADAVPRSDVEELTKENESLAKTVNEASELIRKLRSENNRLKAYDEERDIQLHQRLVREAKQEVAREIFKQAFDYPTLADWYISSVDDRDTPVWTDEHIEELLNDFYVIPKEIADGYKV